MKNGAEYELRLIKAQVNATTCKMEVDPVKHTPSEKAWEAYLSMQKECGRISSMYKTGKITEMERDFMRIILNATMRRFGQIAREAEDKEREMALCNSSS